ncbi:hypothetical protein PROFUN_15740 [Planoprotostelium fungivorum]|uniref:Uncharacterized protein n=1 Tax=Planoprotostelium fungivorum TaxID=1890364 RepID=A0A2P6MUR1_9EUKA|nr:hypothetical protein PROFUN_15740 [Planoprotostelium fungivorum]
MSDLELARGAAQVSFTIATVDHLSSSVSSIAQVVTGIYRNAGLDA